MKTFLSYKAFSVKCFRSAKPVWESPSRAFAQLLQSIPAPRDDSGNDDSAEKLLISCATEARAAWAH